MLSRSSPGMPRIAMRAPCHLILAAAFALAPAVAAAEDAPKPFPACEKTPTEGDVAGAKGAFQAGQASFEEGDYNRAASSWDDASRRDCAAHALLLNLARAFELNNQRRHAVGALETYLARQPSSPQRDQIARRIEGLNEKVTQDAGKAGVSPAPGPDGNPPAVGVDPETPTSPDTGGSRPITPLIVAGAGGVITILGAVLYLGASSDVKDIEDQCGGGRNCPPKLAEEGNDARSRQTTWGIVTIGGLAVTAGGLVWYLVSKPSQATSTGALKQKRVLPRVDSLVGRGFAGLGVSGSF